MTEKAPLWEPFYPASFSTPCVTSVFRRKPLFRTGHRTRQIWLICEWDLGLAWLANPHRLEKLCLPKRPSKTAKQGLVWEQGGCFLTLPAETAHKPTQPVTQGVPAWLSYLMLSSSVHPEIFSPSAAGRIAPPLPGSGGW